MIFRNHDKTLLFKKQDFIKISNYNNIASSTLKKIKSQLLLGSHQKLVLKLS